MGSHSIGTTEHTHTHTHTELWQEFSTGGGSEGVLGFADTDWMLNPILPPLYLL